MDAVMTNYLEGHDFGSLRIIPGSDDDVSLVVSGGKGDSYITIPLYAHEARYLIEVLTPLANEPDAE